MEASNNQISLTPENVKRQMEQLYRESVKGILQIQNQRQTESSMIKYDKERKICDSLVADEDF